MEENEKKEEEKIQENNKGKKSLWVIIILIFALIVLLVGYGLIKLFTGDDNCTNNKTCNETNNIIQNINSSNETGIIYPDPYAYLRDDKPIIYLYPEKETELTVKLGYPEKITCSYPKYENGWNVIAKPDGTIIDKNTGRELYSLYWEGKDTANKNMNEGFVVKGKDSAKFLEEKLEILGLNEREAEEFIVYWLPKLEANKYNYIRFATEEEINEYMPLEFSVKPDTLIRVLMQFKGLDEKIKVQEQKLETPTRQGFVAVEWGGTEIK